MCSENTLWSMHQNTQFHIEKQKSSTPWEGGTPPSHTLGSLRSLAGGFQEIWNASLWHFCLLNIFPPFFPPSGEKSWQASGQRQARHSEWNHQRKQQRHQDRPNVDPRDLPRNVNKRNKMFVLWRGKIKQ